MAQVPKYCQKKTYFKNKKAAETFFNTENIQDKDWVRKKFFELANEGTMVGADKSCFTCSICGSQTYKPIPPTTHTQGLVDRGRFFCEELTQMSRRHANCYKMYKIHGVGWEKNGKYKNGTCFRTKTHINKAIFKLSNVKEEERTKQVEEVKEEEEEKEQDGKEENDYDLDTILIPDLEGIQIGMGIDYETYVLKTPAFMTSEPQTVLSPIASHGEKRFKICKTSGEFFKSLKVAAEASFKGFGLKAAMKAASTQTENVKESSTYFMGSCVAQFDKQLVPNYTLMNIYPEALNLLQQEQYAEFRKIYGTHQVIGLRKGSCVLIQGSLTHLKTNTSSDVSAKLEASWDALTYSVKGSAEFNQYLKDAKDDLKIDWVCRWEGLAAGAKAPPISFEDSQLMDYLSTFPQDLPGQVLSYIAVPYSVFNQYPHNIPPTPIFTDPRLFNAACRVNFLMNKYLAMSPQDQHYMKSIGLAKRLNALFDRFQHSGTVELLDFWSEIEDELLEIEISWDRSYKRSYCRKLIGFEFSVESLDGQPLIDYPVKGEASNHFFKAFEGLTWYVNYARATLKVYYDNKPTVGRGAKGFYVVQRPGGDNPPTTINRIGLTEGQVEMIGCFYSRVGSNLIYNELFVVWGEDEETIPVSGLAVNNTMVWGKHLDDIDSFSSEWLTIDPKYGIASPVKYELCYCNFDD